MTQPEPLRPIPRWTWIWTVVIAGVVLAVFYEARLGELLAWDDDINIVGNTHLHGLTAENLRWMFTDVSYMRRYVPLAWLGWAIDYECFGLTARSCHVGTLLLHAVNAVLLFGLLRKIVCRAGVAKAKASEGWIAAVTTGGTLLWALHPLRVEVVAWASGRMYAQALGFALLATWAYLGSVEAERGSRRRVVLLGLSAALYAASLLSYPIALGYLAVLVALDAVILRRFQGGPGFWRNRENWFVLREKLPFAFVAALVLGVTLVARFNTRAFWAPAATLEEFGVFSRMMQALYVWAYYLWKPLLPSGLAPVYTTLVEFSPTELIFGVSAAIVVIGTGLAWWFRRKAPGLLALWLCHLVLLVPMLGLTEHPHYASDRYSYLQGALWIAGLVVLLARTPGLGARRAMLAGVAGLVLVCAALSRGQIRIWRNSETLFRFLYEHVGDNFYRADIAVRLGHVLLAQNRLTEAVPFYEESLRRAPGGSWSGLAWWSLARIAEAQGRKPDALNFYARAIQAAPTHVDAHYGYGRLLLELGDRPQAIKILRETTALDPHRGPAWTALGAAYFHSGDAPAAIEAFAAAVREAPSSLDARTNLVAALQVAGRGAEAVAQAREAVRVAPTAIGAWVTLGDALRQDGKPAEAESALREALRLDPRSAAALDGLGVLLAVTGRVKEAVEGFQAATNADPNRVDAWFHLALALRDTQQREEAVAAVKKILQLNPNHPQARQLLGQLERP